MIGRSVDNRTPVIIGVGEAVDRPTDLRKAHHPTELMAAAIRAAEADAGTSLIPRIDDLQMILQITWSYPDAAAALCDELQIAPPNVTYGAHGGHAPMQLIHEAALRIASGETQIAAICGGEAMHSRSRSEREGVNLPWPEQGPPLDWASKRARMLHPLALKLGMVLPVATYPLYENATAVAWGQTPADARAESGLIWSNLASVASENPSSWDRNRHTSEEILGPDSENRVIAWPYTKRMVANPMVNQGAAVILTSVGIARELGVSQDKMIFIHGGASSAEPPNFLERCDYSRSPGQEAVLNAARGLAPDGRFDALELYSCFPCVPKMTRRILGVPADGQLSVTGGLSFFGGPLNNYMTHAACAMVQRLRGQSGLGLLYGQGGHITWHHALVLGAQPGPALSTDYKIQTRSESPKLAMNYTGPAKVETFTLIYDKTGAPIHGVVILRTPNSHRLMARVVASDCLGLLTDPNCGPIGLWGAVEQTPDEIPEFKFAA